MFSALLYTAAISPSQAQNNQIQFKRWTVDEGLPQNSVGQITQTKDGYIWVPTQGGIARFDGVRFENFDVNREPELRSNRISVLCEMKDGRLLLGTLGGGLVVYENHMFKNISEQLGITNQMVQLITTDKQNRIWVITEKSGILVLDDKTLLPLDEYRPLRKVIAQNIYETLSGEMILEHGPNTRIWKNGELLDPKNYYYISLLHRYKDVTDLSFTSAFTTHNNTLWLSSPSSLFKIQDHRLVKEYPIPGNFRKGNYVLGLFQIKTDQLLFTFNNSDQLVTFDMNTEEFTSVDLDLQCPGTRIKYVYKDREQNIWYTTSTCGLIRENRFHPKYVDTDPAIINHNVYPVMQDSKGRFIIGTHQTGLEVIENGKSVDVPAKHALPPSSFPYSIVEFDSDDFYMTCNSDTNVTRFNQGKITSIDIPGNNSSSLRPLYKTLSNELLLGTAAGIFYLHENKFQRHPLNDQTNGALITSFFEDSKRNLWMLSDKNLFEFNQSTKEFKKFSTQQNFKTQYLRGVCEDKEGRLYFGSYGYGLLMYDGLRFYELSMNDGLLENVISTITDDGKGNLWLTGNNGLSKLKKQNLTAFLEKKDSRLTPTLFDRSEGLRSAEFNGGVQQSKCEIENNVYLFPTMDGCVKIDFNAIENNLLPPPVIIESIRTEDSTYLALANNTIPYSAGRTEFTFTALSFSSPKDVKFKYRLEGYDEGWKDGGTERKTSYTKITPGSYKFHVIACNNDGVWNNTGASIVLEIVPPFSMTWWFRTIVLLIIAFTLSALVLVIDRGLKRKENEKLKAHQKQEMKSIVATEERERKRIAADLHDSVGQLLTNVKFNVGSLSEKNQNLSSEDKLLFDNSKKSLQDITTELRNISYNLHPPSLVQFGLASAIEEEIKNIKLIRNIDVEFINDTIDSRFDPEIELALYRVFQEVVTNVMKHSGATELSVQLMQHDLTLQLVVEDNGKGFVMEEGLAKKSSNGLKNLNSRVLMLDGKILFDSMQGRGTTVIIELPLKG